MRLKLFANYIRNKFCAYFYYLRHNIQRIYLLFCKLQYLITAIASKNQLLQNQKRRQDIVETKLLSIALLQLLQKKTNRQRQLLQEIDQVYRNILFKIQFTRQALDKFDRQNKQIVNCFRITIARILNIKNKLNLFKSSLQQLSCFVKYNNLDFRDLRKVDLVKNVTTIILLILFL